MSDSATSSWPRSVSNSDAGQTTPEESDEKPALPRFNYVFARDKGLIVLKDTAAGFRLGYRKNVNNAPGHLRAILEARRYLNRPIVLEELPDDIFEKRLSEIYSAESLATHDFDGPGTEDLSSLAEGLPITSDVLDTDDDAPVIRLINALIAEAVKTKASDIHIEPFEKNISIRFRIDSVLREVLQLPSKLAPVLSSRVKVMARLDIAEKRIPQDGRISISLGSKTVDVRISTLPSRFGERVVMRLLDKEHAQLDLDQLGMPPDMLEDFRKLLIRPNGIILVTGPTGSGKTTTLYSGLNFLNSPSHNILTVEDPVEYAIEGIGQTQVNSKVGMTFAAGLRAILRQDPDIVMVGEIRDVETAQIAIQASLTGHLVLSTVHTNSAAGAITRLKDMGLKSFLLSSTIIGVLAQRLVRRLCENCRKAYHPPENEQRILEITDASWQGSLFGPVGCQFCNMTGYDGRIGIYELLLVDAKLKDMIHDAAPEQEIESYAFARTDTLAQCGYQAVRKGITSLEEVLRVAQQLDGVD